MVIITNYKVKNYLRNFQKGWNKFLEIFRGKFPNSQPTDRLHYQLCHTAQACVVASDCSLAKLLKEIVSESL